ncbi:transglycosylase SLT domain-containing protein [Testudinibacter sp. TR-2022]|uniref:transglycosylase SLT domain-containing protein n=1 Tax=Testudinibacter sp. TR-2022 TaxID=2585029 RepID=UPI001119E5A5|nr:transglycosylase SLT domain-containing protein [Testudinibacter sp. TR-2022]TNH06746.1 lytic murein transglycosylase [Pasteurellaceae bacterium Phil11]TNH20571.1 lytic murein transglycosylase [Testudinibacter sp. TR-2022]TNH26068.1 lytic murein transglycosylase [Testudinibacter sp. TR-2022]
MKRNIGIICGLFGGMLLQAPVLAEPSTPLTREQQREIYQKAEALLPLSAANNQFAVVDRLIARLEGYPLLPDLQYQRLIRDTSQLSAQKITQFAQQYPTLAAEKNLDRTWYQTLQQRQDWQGILQFSATPPQDRISRCIYFAAQARQVETGQGQARQTALAAMDWQPVSQIWLNGASLPAACDDLFSLWQAAGQQTDELVRQRALLAFAQGSDGVLRHLRNQSDDVVLTAWLENLVELRTNPQALTLFVQTAAVDANNAEIIQQTFPRYVNQLNESEISAADPFAPYAEWSQRFGLNAEQTIAWRSALISKLFDSDNPQLQRWRDQQLQQLKQDNLTERRIRLAILAQQDLSSWLNLLSNEARSQQEWRFWQAFDDDKKGRKTQARQQWQQLAQERGFYPMLAAEQLNLDYQPYFALLDQAQAEMGLQPLAAELERIEEWLAVGQYSQAKQSWSQLLAQQQKMTQIALAEYANRKQWYEFGVQATIQAKAWDYLTQRLPFAYPLWFELNLQGKSISSSFALAIARQESAWDPNAQSHANARGLMQLLPSTAKATADKFGLPYNNERQLFDTFDNIMLGTQHLQELADRFGNNRIFIAAAYNAGSSRVDRWLNRAGGRLSMAEFIATIPFYETRGYVQNVLTFDYYYQMLAGNKRIKFAKIEADRLY